MLFSSALFASSPESPDSSRFRCSYIYNNTLNIFVLKLCSLRKIDYNYDSLKNKNDLQRIEWLC